MQLEEKIIINGEKLNDFFDEDWNFFCSERCENQLAFRSEYNFEHRTCQEEEKLKKQAEEQFWKKVSHKEIDRDDIEAYEKILEKLRTESIVCCKECKGKCKIVEQKNLEKIQRNRSIYGFQNLKVKTTSDLFGNMMTEITDAVNNEYSVFRSYSKLVSVPLFKYADDGILKIGYLNTNSIRVEVEISYYERYDVYGEYEPYFKKEIAIPLSKFQLKKELIDYICDEVSIDWDYESELTEIELKILEITIDISCIARSKFDNYANDNGETWIKRYASYRTDKEVLTTIDDVESNFACEIKNKELLQIIRFVFLLKIMPKYTKKAEEFVYCLYAGGYGKIKIPEQEKKQFLIIWRYLSNYQNVENERKQFEELCKSKNFYFHNCQDKEYFSYILEKTEKSDYLFEHSFFKELVHLIDC